MPDWQSKSRPCHKIHKTVQGIDVRLEETEDDETGNFFILRLPYVIDVTEGQNTRCTEVCDNSENHIRIQ